MTKGANRVLTCRGAAFCGVAYADNWVEIHRSSGSSSFFFTVLGFRTGPPPPPAFLFSFFPSTDINIYTHAFSFYSFRLLFPALFFLLQHLHAPLADRKRKTGKKIFVKRSGGRRRTALSGVTCRNDGGVGDCCVLVQPRDRHAFSSQKMPSFKQDGGVV